MDIQLFPEPQDVTLGQGIFTFPPTATLMIANAPQCMFPIAQRLKAKLVTNAIPAEITASAAWAGAATITLAVDAAGLPKPESYRLTIAPEGIRITGADAAGVFYGVCTLIQLLQGAAVQPDTSLPALTITDWPDFCHRGVMLDISRDKVPTLETLLDLVEMLASWKINELQLYMEHTFAYRGHETVWQEASPFTGEELLALDAFCRERFIELVPNQNSFGHMHRWLIHDTYKHLAECPDGITHPFSPTKEPFGLCPTDPASLAFLASLYDQLLPHFSSQRFNVGMDETFDLGRGRSAHACTHQSKERVYLDFLKQVHALVSERGRRMQFWGDIILCQPALIPELPADAIAMEWGYEANHPFAEDCRHFAEAGLDFYVCPGTSSWNSIAGRTDNMLGNLMNAAQNGVLTGAIGLLNTDWGDHGHLQPLPISYAGFLAGAGVSWNTNTDLFAIDLPALLDRFVFRDSSGVMGKLAYDLGNVYRHVGYVPENGSLLFYSLVLDADPAMIPEEAQVTANTFARAVQRIDDILAPLDTAQMARPDAAWIKDEFAWAGALLRCACRLNQARLENPAGTGITTLPEAVRGALASELQTLIDRHRALWLRRNRPGGLVDSANRFQRLLSLLEV